MLESTDWTEKDFFKKITRSEMIELFTKPLTKTDLKVYLMIRMHRYEPKENHRPHTNPTGSCWLSVEQLAELCSVTPRSVGRCTDKLQQLEMLRVHRSPRLNQYHLWNCRCSRCEKSRFNSRRG